MFFLYLMAIVPIVVGFIAWRYNKKIVLLEWAISSVIAIITVVVFHFVAIAGMTTDIETWSGKICKGIFYPRWVEEYQVAIYKTVTRHRTVTDSKGRSHTETYTEEVFSHYETRYRTHTEHWEAIADYGLENQSYSISKSFYNDIMNKFGNNQITERVSKSGFYSGDHNIYYVNNETKYIFPTNQNKMWCNKVKAAPSVFSFVKVPENIGVFNYPKSENWQVSSRLLGSAASKINIYDWDVLNAKLGSIKKVNIILIGFDSADSMLGQYQEAKFIGGKKNDLILTYGEVDGKIVWTYVFGWTESSIVKKNLETILLENKINKDILPLIEKEVYENYQKKDWHKFDYLSIEPPFWSYFVLFFIIVATQTGCYLYSLKNEFNKE